jgi:hypothetical protein
VTEGEEFFKLSPGFNLEKGVSPEDKEEGTRVNLLEITDRIDGIRFSAPLQFDVGRGETGIGSQGKSHHIQAMRRICNPLRLLVRRNRRRDEDHLLEVKKLSNLLRSPEMSQMNGIKGPPEETHPLFSSFRFDP